MTSLNEQNISKEDLPILPSNIDWKQRCSQIEFEHQMEIERVRLHYDRELKDKLTEIRSRLKQEYDYHFQQLRTYLLEQQRLNTSSSSINLDRSLGEQVREQIRIAQEYDRYEDEQRQKLLSQQTIDNDELKRLVNKLHTEGIHVLTLSELLSLRLNGINLNGTEQSIGSIQKLHEENLHLRSLIANMNSNENGNVLIQCLADVFRCEQERRLLQLNENRINNNLEQEIRHMCQYQRNALDKLLKQDCNLLLNELENTKEQLNYLKDKFEQIKQNQNQSLIMNSQHLNKFYLKYLRSEMYRKSLIYQKRYLIILLTGYEDTEAYALNEIRRLTGNMKITNSYSMKKTLKQQYYQNSIRSRFRFRSYATVVIATVRLRWLVKKWTRKIASIR